MRKQDEHDQETEGDEPSLQPYSGGIDPSARFGNVSAGDADVKRRFARAFGIKDFDRVQECVSHLEELGVAQ